jgi:hypothetical protein
MRLRFAPALAVLAMAAPVFAQGDTRGNATFTLDGKKIVVDYGRPALKGRAMADLLKQLPAERIWRVGDGAVTTLSTEADLVIGGKAVKAGKYSVYTHSPAEGAWSLILNTNQGVPLGTIWKEAPENMKNAPWPALGNYEQTIKATEVLRVPLTAGKATAPAEQVTISFAPAPGGATLTLAWGAEIWSIDVKAAKK